VSAFKVDGSGDGASGHSLWSGPDKRPKNVQPIVLCKAAKAFLLTDEKTVSQIPSTWQSAVLSKASCYQRFRPMYIRAVLAAAVMAVAVPGSAQTPIRQTSPHNVVIFVADGLRSRVVNDATAPNFAALTRQGVSLVNSHSLFPTFTMANASAIATGHYLGDTGVFSNTLYVARR